MRALVFHGPGRIDVEEYPDPVPGPGDVLLRISATGICGSDLHGYTGESGRRRPGQIMGHETVGRIVAVGAGVPAALGLTPGRLATVNPVIGCGACAECAAGNEQLCARRRVIGVDPALPSAFAELMRVPAGNVVTLPDEVPEEYGALVEPLAVGYHAAVRGAVGPGDRVLVIGGGPIGQACALAARRLGAGELVVSEPNAYRRALLRRLGFAAVKPAAVKPAAVEPAAVEPVQGDALARQVADLLGTPATVVLDAVGTTVSLGDALAATALGGRIVLVGMNAPEVTLPAYAVSTAERSVIGSFCYSSREFRATAEWVAARPPGLEHLIDGRVPLAAAPDAFARLASGALDATKVLVRCAPEPA